MYYIKSHFSKFSRELHFFNLWYNFVWFVKISNQPFYYFSTFWHLSLCALPHCQIFYLSIWQFQEKSQFFSTKLHITLTSLSETFIGAAAGSHVDLKGKKKSERIWQNDNLETFLIKKYIKLEKTNET